MKYSTSGHKIEKKYSPDQDRDEGGRFGSGSSAKVGGVTTMSRDAAQVSKTTRGSNTRESRNARAATDKAIKIEKQGGTPKEIEKAHRAASEAHNLASTSVQSWSDAEINHINAANLHYEAATYYRR